MYRSALSAFFLVALLGPAATAQRLDLDPSVPIGSTLNASLSGNGLAPFCGVLDLDGTERALFGSRVYLGFTPSMQIFDSGMLPPHGTVAWSIVVPNDPAAAGIPVYAQAFLVFPNGVVPSNGASTAFHESASALTLDFADALRAGFTGDFDSSVNDRLQGAAVRRRVHRSVDPTAIEFDQPVEGAFNRAGVREQVVFRPVDLGSSGRPEVLVAIRWRPFQRVVVPEVHPSFVIDAVHTAVTPDYTLDPQAQLPQFPNSGLDRTFANNPRPGEPVVRLASGSWTIDPVALRADGYYDYPLQRSFAFNGADSLLLDFRVTASGGAGAANGQTVQLMVPTAPFPYARVALRGEPSLPVDPNQATFAQSFDSALYDYQFEFADLRSEALSPWLAAPRANPDYKTPIVAASIPTGSGLALEYRGADDAAGSNASAWSASVDIADGRAYVQVRALFTADLATGAVPSIDTLVLPAD